MKRLILLSLLVALLSGAALSQVPDEASAPILLNYSTLKKKVDKSDEAIRNEKKNSNANTWVTRGKLYQDVDNLGLEQAQLGLDKRTVTLVYGDPVSTENKEEFVEILKYEGINYIFENERLRGWSRDNPLHEDPLGEALKSYQKAVELTEAEKQLKLQEKLKKDLDELKEQFLRQGLNDYYLKDFEGSLESFQMVLETNTFEIYKGIFDTIMINYSGITARDLGSEYLKEGKTEEGNKMFRKAIKYYNMLADAGYGGSTVYRQLTGDYYMLGDTLGAIENLKKGLKQYPDSTVLISLAGQAYYQLRDNEGGIAFLNDQLEVRPECAIAYYWKGLLLTNKENIEEDLIKEALALYDTSLMYNPGDENVWYQSGYVNYAVGANYFEQEGYEEDEDFRKELNAKGSEYYEKSVEMLEKTYSVAEENANKVLMKESLDLLKRIYYKLYGGDDARYKSVTDRLNNL